MADLFGCSIRNISIHLQNIFNTAELSENSVMKDYFITAGDKKDYVVKHYNLDAIISVGYRVSSIHGTQFRIWSTQKLKEYIIKGFVLDDERLSDGRTAKTYFEELEIRIRHIRVSEANFYQKVKDVFATSADYDSKTDYAQKFFAVVQNKFHFAITGLTAAEIVSSRIDSNKNNLGLTNFKGEIVTRDQAEVAKNYLEELELRRLNLLVEQFLSLAELKSVEKVVMYMRDWAKKLDGFLILNDKEILRGAGGVSHEDMEERVRRELAKYNMKFIDGSVDQS